MAIGLGALASGYTGAWSDFYRMMIEQELQRRNQANQYDLSYQNWQKQQQYLQQQNAPLLQRQQAWQQLQEFERTYPQQQILGNPALQSHWQQLRTQAGVPLATGPQGPGSMQQVGPPTGTGPGLAAVGTPQPIGPQAQLPILPQRPVRQTLSDYDPRFGRTAFAGTPLPIDQSGNIDSAGLVRFYELAGLRPPQGGGTKPKPNPLLAELQRVEADMRTQGAALATIQSGTPEYAKADQALRALTVRRAQLRYQLGLGAMPQGPPQGMTPPPSGLPALIAGIRVGPNPPGLGGSPQVQAAQPAVGAPPVSTGTPPPPARTVGAPPITAEVSALTAQFPPARFAGRQKRNPQTGHVFQSNGTQWLLVR